MWCVFCWPFGARSPGFDGPDALNRHSHRGRGRGLAASVPARFLAPPRESHWLLGRDDQFTGPVTTACRSHFLVPLSQGAEEL